MHTYQQSATCLSSTLASRPLACKPMAMWFRSGSTNVALPLRLTLCLLAIFFAALPGTAYSVSIQVDTTEFSAFGAKGAFQENSSSTFAGAQVQLGSGTPTFGFPQITPFTAPRAEAMSFGSEDGTFGGYVNTSGFGVNGLGQKGNAGGIWSETYVRDANTTEIPFRISNTKLMLVDSSIESDPNPTMNASLQLAIFTGSGTAAWNESVSIGAPNGQFEITDQPDNFTGNFTVVQSGAPPDIPLADHYAEYIFDTYEGSIDISNIDPGESFSLDFAWIVSANQGDKTETGAFASFYDPVGDIEGFSFDLTGLTPVDGGSPVPIPGAAWLFLSGLLLLGRRSRLTST